jgi:hypothetical protein
MRQQDNLPASIQDDVYAKLSDSEKAMLGFKSSPFGRIDPRIPGDRGNVDALMPFIPELKRGGDRKAVQASYVGSFAIQAYDKSNSVSRAGGRGGQSDSE